MDGKNEDNNSEATGSGNAQPGESLGEELSLEPKGEETVESLKARLAKAEEERENYKRGMLKYKAENAKKDDEEEEDDSKGDKDNVDVAGIATQAATQTIEKANERQAINRFTNRYPALKDPDTWKKVIENYVPRAGKLTVESIESDLEAALILAKHYGGGKVAEKEVSLSKYATVSVAGSIADRDPVSELSNSSIELGKSFGHSVEELQAAGKDDAHVIQIV